MKIGQFFKKAASGTMILAALSCPVLTSCYDDSALNERIDNVEQEIQEIKGSLAALENAAQTGLSISDYKAIEGGYELTFTDGSKINIYNGAKGEAGVGVSPVIGVREENGVWYWTLNGELMLDTNGNKIPTTGKDGANGSNGSNGTDGTNGKDGVTPVLKIEDGYWYVSCEGGADGSWVKLGQATGDKGDTGQTGPQGEPGDAFFQSVELSENGLYLVITLVDGTVYELPLEGFNIVFDLSNVKGYMENQPVKIPYSFVGEAEAKVSEVTVRVLQSENCQVEIDKYNQVVTITPEVGEGYVDLYAIYNPTGELRAKTISFTADNYFEITNSAYAVSPVGGNVEVPVITSAEYNLEIDGDWLTYTETKAIRTETIVLTAGANETGADRTATVTLRLKGDTKVLGTFEVTQKVLDTKLVGKEYAESCTIGSSAHNGTLKFELSDDFSKGVYKVTICGVTVYADVEGNTLKLYDGTRPRPLTFSDDYSKVTSSTQFDLSSQNVYGIKNYQAFIPLGPAELTDAETALVGTYTESWIHKGSAAGVAGGMVISASDEASYGQLKVRFLTDGGSYYESYTSLVDGTLTLEIGGQSHPKYNDPFFATTGCQVTLTVKADGTITLASHDKLAGLADYVATKSADQGGEEGGDDSGEGVSLEALVGTWHQKFNAGSNYENDLMTIELSDDASKGQLKVKMFVYQSYGTTYQLACYANLSEDGTTLTVLSNGVNFASMGTFSENMVMTVSEGGNKIEFNKTIKTSYQMPIGMLTATKN